MYYKALDLAQPHLVYRVVLIYTPPSPSSQILSRIAGCLRGDVLLREFVPFFEQLSSDSMFHVRKAFAMCCKDLSPALSIQQTEQYIVSAPKECNTYSI